MNNNLKTIIIAVATALIGYFAGTTMNPSVDFNVAGADFNVALDSTGNVCMSFEKTFVADDVNDAIEKLTSGIGDGNSVNIILTSDSAGNFTLSGKGCNNFKRE